MSDWWRSRDNAGAYLEMCTALPATPFPELVSEYLPEGSSILELGMGPGKDLELLSRRYRMVGSDISGFFLDEYRRLHPRADLLLLDAVGMEFPEGHAYRLFDAVVSNKVLIHLLPGDLVKSFSRQMDLVGPGGLLCHSFWAGSGEESAGGFYSRYWTPEDLSDLLPHGLEIKEWRNYREEGDDDSFFAVFRKKA